MKIVTRAAWGAKHSPGRVLRGPLGEVVGHTEAVDRPVQTGDVEVAAMRATERFHVEHNGWSGIGYSFCIFPSGRIYEGRGWLRQGAHTEGRNSSAHGLCFMGHGDRRPATAAQWDAARWLIAEGIRLGAVAPDPKISGHRDYSTKGKSCPGDLIYPHLGRLRGITGHQEDEDMPSEEFFSHRFDRLEAILKGQTGAIYNAANKHHGEAMEVRWRAVNLTGAEGELLAKIQTTLDQHGRQMAEGQQVLEQLADLAGRLAPDTGATQVLD